MDVRSIHGTFGTTGEWGSRRNEVVHWLQTEDLGPVVERFTAYTGLTDGILVQIHDWLRSGLVRETDSQVARDAGGTEELSELLAAVGVLPMFGFPTRVRQLLEGYPSSTADLAGKAVPTGLSTWPSACSRPVLRL